MYVDQRRGTIVESRHRVHVAVVDGDGRLVARAGDPDLVTFWRSAAKPFQAMPLVADGVAERFELTREMVAIACASHSSEPAQVQLVRDFLAKIGCSERDLLCGPHPPLSDKVAKDYETHGVRLTPVYSNCSGKHTAMLALARYHGWPTEFYTRLDHPVQQRCLAEVGRWSDVPVERIGVAVDGCGVACFAIPLRAMALAYGRLASATAPMRNAEFEVRNVSGSDEQSFRIPHSAFRILEAMLRHPELLAGEGRPCTDMMRAHPGRVITKVGADGVYSALLPQERLGVALKVADGHGASAALAMAAVLAELGLRPSPESLRSKAVTNWRGEPVGDLRVNGGLER
jgi:L-asparaginase II